MAECTPGPWHVNDAGVVCRTGGCGVFKDPPLKVANGWREDAWYGPDGDEESRANARLIAAAPDLLSALRLLLNDYIALAEENGCDLIGSDRDPEVVRARAAIASATGEVEHG